MGIPIRAERVGVLLRWLSLDPRSFFIFNGMYALHILGYLPENLNLAQQHRRLYRKTRALSWW